MSSSFSFDIPPTSDGLYDAGNHVTVVLVALLCPLTTLAVILRFVARRKTKAKLWWDDGMTVVSLLYFYGFSAICMIGVENGGGYPDILLVPVPHLVITLKATFAGPIISSGGITSTKLAALLLYARIFHRDKTFKIGLIVIGVFGVAWLIGAALAFILRCNPVYYAWDVFQTLGPNCYGFQEIFLATEVPNCILDFLIVFLPVVIIRKLNLRKKDKLMLSGVFLLGGLVGIVSIARMIEVYTIDGLEFINISSYWLLGQQAAAILCVCLPLYKPLFPKTKIAFSLRTVYNSLLRTTSKGTADSRITESKVSYNLEKPLPPLPSTTSTIMSERNSKAYF